MRIGQRIEVMLRARRAIERSLCMKFEVRGFVSLWVIVARKRGGDRVGSRE
jgi:hypothetical protein